MEEGTVVLELSLPEREREGERENERKSLADHDLEGTCIEGEEKRS